jgi:hypothetical protein
LGYPTIIGATIINPSGVLEQLIIFHKYLFQLHNKITYNTTITPEGLKTVASKALEFILPRRGNTKRRAWINKPF